MRRAALHGPGDLRRQSRRVDPLDAFGLDESRLGRRPRRARWPRSGRGRCGRRPTEAVGLRVPAVATTSGSTRRQPAWSPRRCGSPRIGPIPGSSRRSTTRAPGVPLRVARLVWASANVERAADLVAGRELATQDVEVLGDLLELGLAWSACQPVKPTSSSVTRPSTASKGRSRRAVGYLGSRPAVVRGEPRLRPAPGDGAPAGETTDGDQTRGPGRRQLGLGVQAGAGQARGTRGARAGHAGHGRNRCRGAVPRVAETPATTRGPAAAGAERDATGLAAAAVGRGDGESPPRPVNVVDATPLESEAVEDPARVAEGDRAGADRRVVRDDGGAGGEGLPTEGLVGVVVTVMLVVTWLGYVGQSAGGAAFALVAARGVRVNRAPTNPAATVLEMVVLRMSEPPESGNGCAACAGPPDTDRTINTRRPRRRSAWITHPHDRRTPGTNREHLRTP